MDCKFDNEIFSFFKAQDISEKKMKEESLVALKKKLTEKMIVQEENEKEQTFLSSEVSALQLENKELKNNIEVFG